MANYSKVFRPVLPTIALRCSLNLNDALRCLVLHQVKTIIAPPTCFNKLSATMPLYAYWRPVARSLPADSTNMWSRRRTLYCGPFLTLYGDLDLLALDYPGLTGELYKKILASIAPPLSLSYISGLSPAGMSKVENDIVHKWPVNYDLMESSIPRSKHVV